jgi:hypothetical protein
LFRKPVVLVVGAGASFDKYGLPLGGTLAKSIADDADAAIKNYLASYSENVQSTRYG